MEPLVVPRRNVVVGCRALRTRVAHPVDRPVRYHPIAVFPTSVGIIRAVLKVALFR